mgnify:CR=1 FL=1
MGPLYIKTDNSLLSSLIKINDLIKYAKENNINTLAITDDSMYGCIEFYIKCRENNIKPIIGLEINNVVLYAINYNGYKNLIKLSTIKSKEEVNINILRKYSDDLICIVPYHNLNNYDNYKFYKYLYKGYTNLDEKNSIDGKKVYLNEVLYLEEKDKDYLKYLYAIKKGVTVNEININKHDNYLLSYQMYQDEINEEIIELCNLELPLHQDLLPIYECPDNLDSFSYLKQLVIIGLKNIFGDKVNKIYLDRLKYELNIINKMGFCNYFLVVWDYVKYAKEHDILVGPGRGSAAGSLVSYCLGITTIDPIKYNLLFERFLNPERISMPDIDIDFEYTKRDEVLKYCINKYGIKKVAPIITFGTLGSKQVIRDVGKCLNMDNKLVDFIAKKIDSKLSLYDNLEKVKQFLNTNELKKLYKISLKLEGLKRHTSIHAAGVVISKYDLDEIIPLSYHDNYYITGYSMEYLETIGLLKMDFLALKNLTLLNNVLKEVNLKLEDIPLNDKKTIEIFTNVDTIGIFQFESSGMINFLRKFKINSFDDIVAAIALFRPGPMNNIDTYIERKNNKKYEIIDSLKPVLSSTYGIIVYQEQIMQIANIMANYSLAEADLLRKAMSKKKEEVLLKEKDKFINQSVLNGYNKDVATNIYNLILKFASYGFNKAHSVSYAMIAYKMAYLKAHYYSVFMKNLLSMVIGSEIKTREYINICKLNVLKPDINISDMDYIIYNDSIVYPLTNIKNVGNINASLIVEERKKANFKDIFDFISRCKNINKNVLDSLNKAGCFEKFINQKTFDDNLEILLNYSELGGLLEDSLKPELISMKEYSKQELMNREIEVFGTYLSEHPITNLKSKINVVNLIDIEKYFNKNIRVLMYVEQIKKIKTKNNKDMYFIVGSDETKNCEFVLFPNEFCDIIIGSIYIVEGKVEKRYDKYQIIINRIKKVDYEK